MAFMFYDRTNGNLVQTGEPFILAGYNLIFHLWEKRGKPTNQGWHMSADDLIREHTKDKGNIQTNALLIDFHPSARNRIGIIELMDVYAYTYQEPRWTPMMFHLREVLYEEYDRGISAKEKEEKIKTLKEPRGEADIIEFLYLKGWNWGRNGTTNAAFIRGPAREYFRKYF